MPEDGYPGDVTEGAPPGGDPSGDDRSGGNRSGGGPTDAATDQVPAEVRTAEKDRAASKPVVGGRHESRERAIHLLYEAQMKGITADEVLDSQVIPPDRYSMELVDGVSAHLGELDALIERLAKGWTLKRMPIMDVVILRVAVFELAHRSDVPRGVVLSEAVELASQYGTDDSSRFVNGLLATAADELR